MGQLKYGEQRVADVGIREATIMGQGIGMAMRGLRPIAEIQYLDYLLYAIQIMSATWQPCNTEHEDVKKHLSLFVPAFPNWVEVQTNSVRRGNNCTGDDVVTIH